MDSFVAPHEGNRDLLVLTPCSPRGASASRIPVTPRDQAKVTTKAYAKDVPLCDFAGDTLETELRRQLTCLQLCVDNFLTSREEVSNQLLSHQLRLITLLEEYRNSDGVSKFEKAQSLRKISSEDTNFEDIAVSLSLCVVGEATHKLEDASELATSDVKQETLPCESWDFQAIGTGQASTCESWDLRASADTILSSFPLDSTNRFGDLEVRWATLVKLAIKSFSRIRWPLLPCWMPPPEQAGQRSFVMKAVREKLGAQCQSFDPVVEEWARRGYYRGRRGYVNAPQFTRVVNVRKSWREENNMGSSIFHRKCAGRRTILHPLSFRRLSWTVFALFCVGYDAVLLTLGVFETLETDAIKAIDWMLRFFWLVDIGVSFRTGYYVKAHYEDRPHRIAKKYISTWFVIDLFSLIPDTLVALLDSGTSDIGSYSATLRWLKIFKLLRLLRVGKCVHLFNCYLESLNSTNAVMSVHMLKYLLLMIIWVHLCGCGWYWIGTRSADSWLQKAKVQHLRLPEIYVISIQWALSLLQGNTDVFPSYNGTEFSFVVAAMLLSILVMTVFISNVTNVLVALQFSWEQKSKQMRALQEYLHRHQVPVELAEIVRKHAEEKFRVDRKLQLGEDDVTDCLPKHIQRQLLQEVRGGMISVNGVVFVALRMNQRRHFENLCCDMLQPLFFSPGRSIYRYSQDCKTTYFNIGGDISYEHISNKFVERWVKNSFSPSKEDFSSKSSDYSPEYTSKSSRSKSVGLISCSTHTIQNTLSSAEHQLMCSGSVSSENNFCRKELLQGTSLSHTQTICEAALFLRWTHMGFMSAITHAAFLSLDSAAFSLLAEADNAFTDFLAEHALRFCRVVNSSSMHPSDLMTSIDVLNTLQTHGELVVNSVRSSTLLSLSPRASVSAPSSSSPFT